MCEFIFTNDKRKKKNYISTANMFAWISQPFVSDIGGF